MPTNFDALLRYHTIDNCLQNRFRKWSLEDLAECCTGALNEAAFRPGGKNTISKRTLQNDIKIMRSSLLGYNAPIVNKDGFYTYAEKHYSIRNASLRKEDIINLSAAIAQLKLYKGLNFFQNIENLLQQLESQVQIKTSKAARRFIQFENIPASNGSEWLQPLITVIADEQAITLEYKRFDSGESKSYTMHPYLLKEYKNRWYLIGWYQEKDYIKIFALDRIVKVDIRIDQLFNKEKRLDTDYYFNNTIGVSYFKSEPEQIILKFDRVKLPYVKTQPIHNSQQVIDETEDYIIVTLWLCVNYELESLILSFADEVEVLGPNHLRVGVKNRLENAIKNFI